MKRFLTSALKISALSALVFAPTFISAGEASAKPTGTNASYLGAGVSLSATNNEKTSDDAGFGGNLQGRVAIPNTLISARGAILFNDETSAIMPMVSYDVPVTNNANVTLVLVILL
jgi:ABC-type polar amino acid transport system ATPase subunit